MANLSDFSTPDQEPEVAESSWECAPCGVTRDSDPLTRANFDALCNQFDAVDPYGDDWEIIRFGHYSVGWIENIFVRPGSLVAELCPDVRLHMAKYPCLDEELWVKYDESVETEAGACGKR